ncbi:MAG: hypothetical protein K9M54_03750 [Kiritimatiellales bacterium]|nr:hypothetical protein [Kiritimatiellales bacterium]MCF7863406.1 hypothetical protein [Kiritimatiellales bacterium]
MAMVFCAFTPAQAAEKDKGGVKGFLAGCCFGPRSAGDYNTDGTGSRDYVSWFLVGCCLGERAQIDFAGGKDVQWREWTPLIPYVGIIFRIWNGIDGANGTTRADFAAKYGSTYY